MGKSLIITLLLAGTAFLLGISVQARLARETEKLTAFVLDATPPCE